MTSPTRARRWRRAALAALATAIAVPATVATATGTSAADDADTQVVFDNLPDPLPASSTSLSFAGGSTNELGDLVQLAPGPRIAESIDVMMVSWACESGHHSPAGNCTTAPEATFDHDITLNIRSVTGPSDAPVLGSVVHTQTNSVDVPFRPSADSVNCTGANAGKWLPDGGTPETGCQNGYAFLAPFDIADHVVLPERFVWSVAFNTTHRGYAPIGTPCGDGTNCGYDSLNVALGSAPAASGTVLDGDDLYIATTYSAYVCGVGAADGTFQRTFDDPSTDGCWAGYQPMARIAARATSSATNAVTVRPSSLANWNLVRETPAEGVIDPDIAVPPVAAPVGEAAAHLLADVTDDAPAGEGIGWANPGFDGVRLSDITSIEYSTLTDSTPVAPSFQFDVQYRTTDTAWAGRLVFEPTYSGTVTDGTWQTWSPLDGTWWATKTNADGSGGLCAPAGATNCTWSEILATFPDATINNPTGAFPGMLWMKTGSGAGAVDSWVDAVKISVRQPDHSIVTTTFDFEVDLTVPSAPTITGTDADVDSVTPAWTAPADDGGTPVTGYEVTVTPGDATCTTAALTCTVDGLDADTTYSINVVARNAVGASPAATTSATTDAAPVVPPAETPPAFVPFGPERLFDTRGTSPDVLIEVPLVPLAAGTPFEVDVLGVGGIPTDGIGAISLNVTIVDPEAFGHLTVYPCGEPTGTSNANYATGDVLANAVVTPLSADGTVCFVSHAATDLVVDVNGWFIDDEDDYVAIVPTRVTDTRGNGNSALDGKGPGRIDGGSTYEIDFSGLGGVIPADGYKAIALNVTAVLPAAAGHISIHPCNGEIGVSSVNFSPGDVVANSVMAELSDDGRVCLTPLVDTDLVVDVSGYLPDSSSMNPASARLFDTRPAGKSTPVIDVPKVKVGRTPLAVKVTDIAGLVPADGVVAVALNVTVAEPDGPGHVMVYPCDATPATSNVNYVDDVVANMVLTGIAADGTVCFWAHTDTHLVVDLNGWVADPSDV